MALTNIPFLNALLSGATAPPASTEETPSDPGFNVFGFSNYPLNMGFAGNAGGAGAGPAGMAAPVPAVSGPGMTSAGPASSVNPQRARPAAAPQEVTLANVAPTKIPRLGEQDDTPPPIPQLAPAIVGNGQTAGAATVATPMNPKPLDQGPSLEELTRANPAKVALAPQKRTKLDTLLSFLGRAAMGAAAGAGQPNFGAGFRAAQENAFTQQQRVLANQRAQTENQRAQTENQALESQMQRQQDDAAFQKQARALVTPEGRQAFVKQNPDMFPDANDANKFILSGATSGPSAVDAFHARLAILQELKKRPDYKLNADQEQAFLAANVWPYPGEPPQQQQAAPANGQVAPSAPTAGAKSQSNTSKPFDVNGFASQLLTKAGSDTNRALQWLDGYAAQAGPAARAHVQQVRQAILAKRPGQPARSMQAPATAHPPQQGLPAWEKYLRLIFKGLAGPPEEKDPDPA
jgi:hypothetical protein